LVQQSLSSTKTGYVAQQPTAVIATAMGDTGVTNNSDAPGVSGLIGAALLWSDMSETPHYSTLFTSLAPTNVSRDWTNEYLVNTISGSMVLSK
jgi:hypothetical protein